MRPLRPLIVVSGYARTGTSLMMRILSFGGVSVLADKDRTETPTNALGNPYGDYEFRNIDKSLKKLGTRRTSGKAVKIVAPYIDLLPLDRPVRVIFMKRDLSEIVASLLALKVIWSTGPDVAVPAALKWLELHNIPTLITDFHELRNYPKSSIMRVADFLELETFDRDAALAALDLNSRKGRNKLDDGNALLYFKGKPVVVAQRGGKA